MSSPQLSTSVSVQGFHFTLSTVVAAGAGHEHEQCALHVVYNLDSHVYADQYELAQNPAYTSTLWGTSDLEKPVSAVDPDGSVLLVTVPTAGSNATLTLDVPLHARYGRPVSGSKPEYHEIVLNPPVGFFSCPSEDGVRVPEALRPYTTLQGWPSSSLLVIPDTSSEQAFAIRVPVGSLGDLAWVDVGTAVVMISMFFYLLVASLRTARRLSDKPPSKTD